MSNKNSLIQRAMLRGKQLVKKRVEWFGEQKKDRVQMAVINHVLAKQKRSGK